MASATVTRRELSLVARDTVTGWCAKSFAETTIDMVLQPSGSNILNLPCGNYAKYPHTGFTADVMHVGDEVKDANNEYYVVKSADKWWWLDKFSHYTLNLQKIAPHADRPSTSGTWHLDSESLRTDVRYRQKTFLETYITDANMKLDDGVTLATYAVMFAGVDYPLTLEFDPASNDLDLVICIDKTNAEPEHTSSKPPYKLKETAAITVWAMNKTGLTAVNLIDQAYEEIKHTFTDHPLGSVRKIVRSQPQPQNLDSFTLYSENITIMYERANDDYTPTAPVFDYGIAFIYEGDRVAGGSEGTWTLTQGAGSTCTQTITSDNNLYLNQTVFGADSSTVNGTNLALSSTTYGKIRIRYKTSGNATAKVILGFSAGTQTVLAESASSTFTVVDVAITAAKTINTITLYACDGVGTVTYDFVEIHTGTYILPNCTLLEPPVMVNDAVIEIPGRVGSVNQALGSPSMEVTMECDLDMQPVALTWKRPQTTTPKTDVNNQDILLETHHRGSFYEDWTWLDLGDPAMQFKARLVEVRPSYSGEEGKVRLVWREYRHGSASGETATERFGLSL